MTYESKKTDGSRFRNTEVLTFEGDKISRVEVYFGWNLECPARVARHLRHESAVHPQEPGRR